MSGIPGRPCCMTNTFWPPIPQFSFKKQISCMHSTLQANQSPGCETALRSEVQDSRMPEAEIERLGVAAVYPNLDSQERQVDVKYINDCLGLSLDAALIADLLSRMALEASASQDGGSVSVLIPPTRSDVLHDADVMEVCSPRPVPDNLAVTSST